MEEFKVKLASFGYDFHCSRLCNPSLTAAELTQLIALSAMRVASLETQWAWFMHHLRKHVNHRIIHSEEPPDMTHKDVYKEAPELSKSHLM